MAPTELPGATGDTVLTWEVLLVYLFLCFKKILKKFKIFYKLILF
jgi:hypothetical protein